MQRTSEHRLLSRFLRWAWRCPVIVLAGTAVVTLCAVPLLARLSFDSNVLHLIPHGGPAVRSFQAYLETFGSLDRLYIVFEAPSGHFVAEYSSLIDDYVDQLRQAPEIQHVDAGPADAGEGWGYVLDNALLLLGPDGVGEALGRFESKAIVRELAHAREVATVPSAGLKMLVREDPLGLVRLLRDRLAGQASAFAVDPARDGYVTPDGRSRLVIAEPSRPPFDTAFCRQLMARLDVIDARVRAQTRDEVFEQAASSGLVVLRAGAYRAAIETEDLIRTEGTQNGIASLAAVLLLVYVVFRSARVLLAGAIPLLVATVLTVAISGMWWPLSTAAAGCAAMVFGVGIDGVLLLYVRYLEERRNGLEAEEAIAGLPPTVISMLLGFTTTAATYFGLLPIDFPSLNEVGRLIGMAILLSGVLAIAIVPALLPQRVSARQARPMANDWLGRLVTRRRRTILWSAAALTLVLGAAAPGLHVDPALQRLQPQTEGTRVEREILTRFAVPDDVILLLGEGPSLEPLLEANQAVVDHLRVRAPDVRLTSPVSFIPPRAAQHAVREAIRESGLSATRVSERFVRAADEAGFRADAFAPFLERLPRLLGASGALTYESYLEHGLADLVRRYVTTTRNGYATVAYVYPRNAAEYAAVEEAVRSSGQRLQMTGVTYVNQELSNAFAPQFLKGALIGSVAVAVLIFVGFRSVRYTVLSLVPTAAGLLWSAGVLSFMNVQLDLFSVFAFLMCIGIGVDYSIHLLHRQATTHDGSVIGPLVSVSPAIIMAWATTTIGFGTLVASSYGPLQSLGLVSVVMLTACLLTSMLVLPAVLLSSADTGS